MKPYLKLLRNRPFAQLWGGLTISMFGDGLTWVSLVWLTFELGGTTADIGILAAVYTAPVIIGGLGAGILLDRFDRRRLLIVDNALRGLAVLSIPLAAWSGVLTQAQVFIVAAVYGLLYMVSLAGFPSMLPDIVAEEDLSTANALEAVSFAVGGIGGPAIAGLLIERIGAAANLAIDAATYGVFVIFLVLLRLPARRLTGAAQPEPADEAVLPAPQSPLPAAPEPAAVPVSGGLRPALRFILASPAILGITIMFMAFNVGEGMLNVLLPVYAREVIGVGSSGYGLLVSAFTGGALAGSLVVGAIRWRWPLGRSIAVTQLLAGLAMLSLAVLPPFALALVILAIVGLFAAPLTIWAQTIRMRLIPAPLRGRTFSLLRTMMMSTPPVGGLLAGIMLAAGGLIPAILVIAAVMGVPGSVGIFHRALSARSTDPAVAGQ